MNRGWAGSARRRTWVIVALVAILLAGLPVAVWLDLRTITDASLQRQAHDLNAVISGIRGFYSSDVVARVLEAHGHASVTDDYDAIDGAIPIPATFSLELGRVISTDQSNIGYRFVSDFPFRHRAPHVLDTFERSSLAALRRNSNMLLTNVSWNGFDNRVRLIAPIIMGPSCVHCHNTDPDSPKRDWKVGDVRGIQELIVTAPVATNIFSFRWLLLYFAFAGLVGIGFIALQNRQTAIIEGVNDELERANSFLSSISHKLSHYLSPQLYRSIFSGERDVAIHTERKKLTIFFSDIKDFTSTTERLQPEELTALLNEYLNEMSTIAHAWGGTIDKFVGDAIIVFFGDPETKGPAEDARACVRMALAMQDRTRELNVKWRSAGVEEPFRVRMGINTGFCNVGNFGSMDRMDYTIIGAEANLSARLESIAEPGTVVISYETYALVRDIVVAHPLAPIRMKGISREVVPYAVEGLAGGDETDGIIAERAPGLDLYVDPSLLDEAGVERAQAVLHRALDRLGRIHPE